MDNRVSELLEILERDNLVALKKILQDSDIPLNSDVVIGSEYDMDEYDEIPLIFYVVMKNVSLEAIEMLIDAGMDINTYTREGLGVIDYAIKHRRKDILKLCKDKGISLTQSRRKSGMTPLMVAASFNDMDMVEYLLKEGATITDRDKFGMSAIDYASRLGNKKMKEFLEKFEEER